MKTFIFVYNSQDEVLFMFLAVMSQAVSNVKIRNLLKTS